MILQNQVIKIHIFIDKPKLYPTRFRNTPLETPKFGTLMLPSHEASGCETSDKVTTMCITAISLDQDVGKIKMQLRRKSTEDVESRS